MTRSAAEDRINRLVGDGKLSGAGALPLPDAFRGVMELLLDDGKVTFAELVTRITDEMHTKERRVISIWGSWESLAADVTEQLVSRQLIHPEHDPDDRGAGSWMAGMLWLLGENVETNKYYDVITRAEVRKATQNPEARPFRVILFDEQTRRERDTTARALTLTRKFRSELERLGRADEVIGRHLDHVIARLEGTKVDNDRPAQPPDEPDHYVTCKLGGEERPRTREFFALYWSRDQWYWRVTCKEHIAGTFTRREHLREAVLQMIDESGGRVPTARDVMRAIGKRDVKQLSQDWDYLALRGELPRRQPL